MKKTIKKKFVERPNLCLPLNQISKYQNQTT